jgi:hypothetical protein
VNPISLREAFAQSQARLTPWTAADEARLDAKREAERAAQAAYEAAHRDDPVEDYEDEEDES